MKLFLLNTIGN
jgi:hypothetical protein